MNAAANSRWRPWSLLYVRDPNVREWVITRASGKCEYCGREGFLKADGSRYLEAHHVIALSHDGVDTIANFIAICPNDHRQAHYGAELEARRVEEEFIKKIALRNN